MGMIEIHPRTFTRSRSSPPTAERRFLETPDVSVFEPLPAIGSAHPEQASMSCVQITTTTGHGGDPQARLYTVRYEYVVR